MLVREDVMEERLRFVLPGVAEGVGELVDDGLLALCASALKDDTYGVNRIDNDIDSARLFFVGFHVQFISTLPLATPCLYVSHSRTG